MADEQIPPTPFPVESATPPQAPPTPFPTAVEDEEEPTEENTHPDYVKPQPLVEPAPVVDPVPVSTIASEPVVSTPVADPVPDDITKTATVPVEDTTAPAIVEETDPTIVKLNRLFATFVKANGVRGKRPEDFKESANAVLNVVKLLIEKPTVPVLDAFLALFTENLNGATAAGRFMMGSSSLSKADELKVGTILALFGDLANKRNLPIAAGSVTAILKKPEFVGYYNRRRQGYAK